MADVDLNSMSRAELVALRTQIDKAIASAGERDRQRALKAAEEAVQGHGFSLAELVSQSGQGRTTGGKRGRRPAEASSAAAATEAKYRNPENAEQTWSGRGRRPGWVNEALEKGRSLDDLVA